MNQREYQYSSTTLTYNRRIPSNDCQIYDITVGGDTFSVTVTASPSVAQRWVDYVISNNEREFNNNTAVVGLGVQWTQTARLRRSAETVELCVGKECLIFQISRTDYAPASLRKLLENRSCTFVVVSEYSHRRMLSLSPLALQMRSDPVNVRSVLRMPILNSSLRAFLEGETSTFTTDIYRYTDWRVETLSDEQVLHASIQVRIAYLLGIFPQWVAAHGGVTGGTQQDTAELG
ncbi:uncharacterized protein LOC113852233 [Abrus precatorius]|uniref:Uncharacterized protein LOC113852233 n=1 Tax=Abrus precatorius TaxID=3816 RepID=A0A8B8K3C3_ABRPR|nr:uncharacterized protein LOC113852233 [Abrus precatorius]